MLTTGNVLGLALLGLSCADQADGAAPVAITTLAITAPDQSPTEAPPSHGPAIDTAHTLASGPAARTTPSWACRCGSRTRPTM
ncbi:hypothetical protein [Streptomyces sp. NPDC008121]|uniref:hypothetical protein n=1 Tax=Streptomyces sp. NPDC008121 TaxID=3364809 RepID=UPI0036E7B583